MYILNIQAKIDADSIEEAEGKASIEIGQVLSSAFNRVLAEEKTAIEAGDPGIDESLWYVSEPYMETFKRLHIGRDLHIQNAGFAERSLGYDYQVKVTVRK